MNRILVIVTIFPLLLIACQPSETAYIIDASETEIPTATPRPTRPTPTAQIQGSVVIGNGGGIMGGIAQETIEIDVYFQAQSSLGEIVEMRVRKAFGDCFNEAQMLGSIWETYVPTLSYSYWVPIGWSTFSVTVQYKDSQGNISLAICQEVVIEGMPPTPTVEP